MHRRNVHINQKSKIPDDTGLHQSISQIKAFITHLGKFQWNVASFGLALLPSYYSKVMQNTLSGLEDFARNYMDDILITSYTKKEHLDHIRQVFKSFQKFKMKLKLA